ncbi:hypothetical protein QZH41_009206, partial [Actinostola sp. cb2023]
MKGNLDQNGNVQIQTTENNRHAYSDKIKEKHMGMTSSDTTITKFLSQIEEARIEEMKERQRDLQERMKETCAAQEAEDALELSIWKCGQCGKSFAQQQILQLHICSSVPEKPYKCTYCTEAFEQPSDLRTHAVIHSATEVLCTKEGSMECKTSMPSTKRIQISLDVVPVKKRRLISADSFCFSLEDLNSRLYSKHDMNTVRSDQEDDSTDEDFCF